MTFIIIFILVQTSVLVKVLYINVLEETHKTSNCTAAAAAPSDVPAMNADSTGQ